MPRITIPRITIPKVMSALVCFFIGTQSAFSDTYNYAEVLQKSLFFYEAQRSGKLPATKRVNWRGDSALNDGQSSGVDLTGGYYDAGDHVKFGLPMAYSMTTLAWGAIAYSDAFCQTGEMDHMLEALKWGTDFIIKAHTAPHVFWGQVGNGGIDHAWWGPAEVMNMSRPAYKIDESHPGSDLAAGSAAALAAVSILYQNVDSAYAATLIQHAKDLYDFADKFRGKYSDSITDAQAYYNSWSGYADELVWGAVWLYKATGDTAYLNKATQEYSNIANNKQVWTHSWDDVSYGTHILLAQLTGNATYRARAEDFLDFWTVGTSNGKVQYTPGGLAWLDTWGSLRYSSTTALLAFIYSDYLDANGLSADKSQRYKNFATQQINYMLGSNPQKRSYVVGFGQNSPLNVHHRTAHGSWANDISTPANNRHILYGALVGGPDTNDQYTDARSNYQQTEVALDYNAGFTGAIAKMFLLYGGTPLTNFPAPETKGTEYFVSAKINSSGPRYTEISAVINNQSAWPAAAPAISYRYFVDLTEVFAKGYKLSDITVTQSYNQGGTISALTPFDASKNIYYVEVSFPAGAVYPGGQSESKKETQFRLSLPSNTNAADWDPTNDWSYKGLSSTAVVSNNIPVYVNGVNVFGSAPTASATGTLCVTVPAVNGLNASDLKPITAGSYSFTVTTFGTAVCQKVAVGNYSVVAPSISNSTGTFTAPAVAATVTENQTTQVNVLYTGVVTPTGQLCVSVAPADGLNASSLKPITAGSYSFSVTQFNTPVCQTVAAGNYTVIAPSLTSGSTTYTAQPVSVSVTQNATTQATVTYVGTAAPQNNVQITVSGLPSGTGTSVRLGNQTVNFAAGVTSQLIHLDPGTYAVSATAVNGYNVAVTPTSITVPSGTVASPIAVSVVYTAIPVTGGSCTVKVQIGGSWQSGSQYMTSMNLFVQNDSATAIGVPWTLTLKKSTYQSVSGAWNWTPSVSGGTVTGSASQSWQVLQPNGQNPINVGMILGASSANFVPDSITLNNVSCKVVVQ